MSYDYKILDQKYHLKGLINKDMCKKLIQFYEDKKHMAIPEASYKFDEGKRLADNFSCLNISELRNNEGFEEPHKIILFYINLVLTNYEEYIRTSGLSPNFKNIFMTKTNNIRILKYKVGECIKDHSDVDTTTRGSLTINLNDDYEGGEFRFFGGQEKVRLSTGEAMLFPAEPIWIHGTEPVIKGVRYTINCFLRS